MSERIIISKYGYGKTAKFYEDLIKETIDEKDKEIERLTELCNKYEEEHKTTFETWQKDIKEIERLKIQVSARETEYEKLHSIIKEAREYIENYNKVIRENKMLGEYANFMIIPKELLEILDKVGE